MREAEFIQRAFRRVAPVVMGGDREVEEKPSCPEVYDVVTDSDVEAERRILSMIAEEFPGDSVVSEELNPDAAEGGRCWVLDPIDGTMNYSRGVSFFGMQAAFMEDGVPVMSAIYLPAFDEMFVADDRGAFLNGSRIRTADPRPLRHCVLSTGDYSRRCGEYREGQAALMSRCYGDVGRFRMFGASCIDYTYLACGRTDVHVRFLNRKWDYMPGMFLATRAGAVFDRALTRDRRLLVLCSCQEVLDEAVLRLSSVMLNP